MGIVPENNLILFKFLKLYVTTDFADFTDYGCALLMLFSQIYYWITAANAAMMKPHGICEIPDNRGDSR